MEIACNEQFSPFLKVFSTRLENSAIFIAFKIANSLSLEECKICRLRKD